MRANSNVFSFILAKKPVMFIAVWTEHSRKKMKKKAFRQGINKGIDFTIPMEYHSNNIFCGI